MVPKNRIKLLPLKNIESMDAFFDELAEYVPIVLGAITRVETSFNTPTDLNEFVGQESPKKVLNIIAEAAQKRKDYLPNILLTGMYGHGKTTLAKLISAKLKTPTRIIDGSLSEELLKTPNNTILYIIDEIHNIPAIVADSLNIALDAKQIHIIGCTTSPGKLPAPFRSRFRQIYLEEYTREDIKQIISRAANRAKADISEESLDLLADRSKLNPRISLSLLDFVIESALVREVAQITNTLTHEALNTLKIDVLGLTELDRLYLKALNYSRPVGLKHLSTMLSLDISTIEEQIEPFLIKVGLIERTARGRLKMYNA